MPIFAGMDAVQHRNFLVVIFAERLYDLWGICDVMTVLCKLVAIRKITHLGRRKQHAGILAPPFQVEQITKG